MNDCENASVIGHVIDQPILSAQAITTVEIIRPGFARPEPIARWAIRCYEVEGGKWPRRI
jgi:hypothetical protein